MKIYNKIVWEWDESKKELVEIESDSYEYEGPLVKAEVATAAIIAAAATVFGTLFSIKGGLDSAYQKKKLGEEKMQLIMYILFQRETVYISYHII